MNNRLGDLPDWAQEPDSEEEEEENEGEDLEAGQVPQETAQDVDKEIFFHAVEQIKGEIAAVQKAIVDIEKINEQAMKATTTEKETELSKKLRRVIDTTNKKAKGAKNLLGELKEENGRLKEAGAIQTSDLR